MQCNKCGSEMTELFMSVYCERCSEGGTPPLPPEDKVVGKKAYASFYEEKATQKISQRQQLTKEKIEEKFKKIRFDEATIKIVNVAEAMKKFSEAVGTVFATATQKSEWQRCMKIGEITLYNNDCFVIEQDSQESLKEKGSENARQRIVFSDKKLYIGLVALNIASKEDEQLVKNCYSDHDLANITKEHNLYYNTKENYYVLLHSDFCWKNGGWYEIVGDREILYYTPTKQAPAKQETTFCEEPGYQKATDRIILTDKNGILVAFGYDRNKKEFWCVDSRDIYTSPPLTFSQLEAEEFMFYTDLSCQLRSFKAVIDKTPISYTDIGDIAEGRLYEKNPYITFGDWQFLPRDLNKVKDLWSKFLAEDC